MTFRSPGYIAASAVGSRHGTLTIDARPTHPRAADSVEGFGILEREQWVVPLGLDETPDQVKKNLSRVADDYDQKYLEEWTDWMADVRVRRPQTLKDAIALYTELSKPDWPCLRILRRLEDDTQWKRRGSPIGRLGERVGASVGSPSVTPPTRATGATRRVTPRPSGVGDGVAGVGADPDIRVSIARRGVRVATCGKLRCRGASPAGRVRRAGSSRRVSDAAASRRRC